LSIDGKQVHATSTAQLAVLGHGARIDVAFDPGTHTIEVRTCRAGDRAGFYLVER
jgi:hypothetical protein